MLDLYPTVSVLKLVLWIQGPHGIRIHNDWLKKIFSFSVLTWHLSSVTSVSATCSHMFLFVLFQAVGDFAHFEQLRWEDQEKIRQRIEAGPGPGKKSTFFAI
jgi:hypothetical protein